MEEPFGKVTIVLHQKT